MTAATRLIGDQESCFEGLSALLRALLYPAQTDKTVCASLERAARRLGITRAGLFLIRRTTAPLHLKVLCSVGLTRQELEAVECGEDPEDAGSSRIWKTIATHIKLDGRTVEPLHRVSRTLDVLSLPISDPTLEVPVAVLYFEREMRRDLLFETLAKEWANVCRMRQGQVIHLGFTKPIRTSITGSVTESMQSDFAASQSCSEELAVAPRIPRPEFIDARVWLKVHYFARIRKVVDYIEAHLDEPIDLKLLSFVGCMERTSFSKLFKSKIGLTLRDFLSTYRISRATSLMQTSDFSVTEIAYAVGFGSVRTFERTFRKVTGHAPSEFRAAAVERMDLVPMGASPYRKRNGSLGTSASLTGGK